MTRTIIVKFYGEQTKIFDDLEDFVKTLRNKRIKQAAARELFKKFLSDEELKGYIMSKLGYRGYANDFEKIFQSR